jgi:hypothetical protein
MAAFPSSKSVVTSMAGFADSLPLRRPVAIPPPRPPRGRLRLFRDAHRSPARSVVMTIRAVPVQGFVVSFLRSKRCSYRRRLQSPSSLSTSQALILMAGFQVDRKEKLDQAATQIPRLFFGGPLIYGFVGLLTYGPGACIVANVQDPNLNWINNPNTPSLLLLGLLNRGRKDLVCW